MTVAPGAPIRPQGGDSWCDTKSQGDLCRRPAGTYSAGTFAARRMRAGGSWNQRILFPLVDQLPHRANCLRRSAPSAGGNVWARIGAYRPNVSRSIRPRDLKSGRPQCVELGMAGTGAAWLIQPRLANRNSTPAGILPKTLRYWTHTGLTLDSYRTGYIRSLYRRVPLWTNVFYCWRVERPDEQNHSNTRVPHWCEHCGVTYSLDTQYIVAI